MATSAAIAYEKEDGSVVAVMCCYDGSLGETGEILRKFYGNRSKVEELLKNGAIYLLGESSDPYLNTNCSSFYDYLDSHDGRNTIYMKDIKDEEDDEFYGVQHYSSREEYFDNFPLAVDVYYLFGKDDKWYYYNWKPSNNVVWHPL